MLSKLTRTYTKTSCVPLLISSKRNFGSFDYIKITSDLDSGKTPEETSLERFNEREERESSHFNWDWIDWYRDNYPDSLGNITSIQNKYKNFEQFVAERGVQASGKSVNFNDFRSQIADPTFVDELEIQYNVDKSTLNSIKNMHTLEEWDENSVKLFEEDCRNSGDLLWKPLTENEKDTINEALRDTELEEERLKELTNEFLKDYEQIDAEFSMFGQDTQIMKFAEYPQMAENLEDRQGGKTAFDDINLQNYHLNFIKREKLRQFQEEDRRKEFLETFDVSSKILNGRDLPHDVITLPRHSH